MTQCIMGKLYCCLLPRASGDPLYNEQTVLLFAASLPRASGDPVYNGQTVLLFAAKIF